jgi:hypothetical protein
MRLRHDPRIYIPYGPRGLLWKNQGETLAEHDMSVECNTKDASTSHLNCVKVYSFSSASVRLSLCAVLVSPSEGKKIYVWLRGDSGKACTVRAQYFLVEDYARRMQDSA